MQNDSETCILSTKQRRFIAALATQPTIRAAAKTAQIAERTAWLYLSDPRVKQEIAQRQGAMLSQVTAGLVADMADARRVLLDVALDKQASDSARVSAAKGILDCGLRLFEMYSLADRVAELERRLSDAG